MHVKTELVSDWVQLLSDKINSRYSMKHNHAFQFCQIVFSSSLITEVSNYEDKSTFRLWFLKKRLLVAKKKKVAAHKKLNQQQRSFFKVPFSQSPLEEPQTKTGQAILNGNLPRDLMTWTDGNMKPFLWLPHGAAKMKPQFSLFSYFFAREKSCKPRCVQLCISRKLHVKRDGLC